MRKTYETPADMSVERAVMDVLAAPGGFTVEKLEKYGPADFALLKNGHVRMVCEVKKRNKHYPQMFVSLAKVQALRDYAAIGIQARVIFATPDGVFSKEIGPGEIDGWIGVGGRSDRGDPKDREMVVFFGDFVVGDKVYKEEKLPMKLVADSNPSWFEVAR